MRCLCSLPLPVEPVWILKPPWGESFVVRVQFFLRDKCTVVS